MIKLNLLPERQRPNLNKNPPIFIHIIFIFLFIKIILFGIHTAYPPTNPILTKPNKIIINEKPQINSDELKTIIKQMNLEINKEIEKLQKLQIEQLNQIEKLQKNDSNN